jgi:hypothetical protein
VSRHRNEYTRTFATLGRPLAPRDGSAESRIAAAERRLGVRAPTALRDYFLVAGRERRFNCVFNRLLRPEDWFVDSHKLVFMEENQAVVYWGTLAASRPPSDPPAFQGVNGDPIEWHAEHERCSVFLRVMLHWQAAYGGAMPWSGTASVAAGLLRRLNRQWSFVGEVNGMRAYSRSGQALCMLQWENGWRVSCGVTDKHDLEVIAGELNVEWE